MLQLNTLLLIQYSLCIPLVAAFFAAVIPYRNIRDGLMVLTSLALPLCVYKIYQIILAGSGILEWKFFEIIPGIALHFRVESLGVIFAIIVAILWVVSLIYSIGYMRGNNEGNQGSFFTFFCIAIFASIGVAFSANMLTLFIFYELITISTYPLVTHNRVDKTKKAGRAYIGILVGTAMLILLPAIIFTFNAAGTLDFKVGGILTGKISSQFTMLLLALYVFGVAKAAIMPVHKWLPRAMVAPTPVSALLHAVVVVKAGVFTILKVVVYIFGIENLAKVSLEFGQYGDWLLYVSAFTIVAASLIALTKDNLKQLLAYSTISQLACVIMALAMFSPKGIIAATFQIVAHAFAKIVMFFAVGSIYTVSSKQKVSELSGIGRMMPFTMGAFTIAAISLIGLPPAVGFIAKWNIIDGAMGAEQFFAVVVIAISTMFNTAYFLPIIYKSFFEKEQPGVGVIIDNKHGEAPFLMVISTCFAALIILVLCVWPDIFWRLAGMVGK